MSPPDDPKGPPTTGVHSMTQPPVRPPAFTSGPLLLPMEQYIWDEAPRPAQEPGKRIAALPHELHEPTLDALLEPTFGQTRASHHPSAFMPDRPPRVLAPDHPSRVRRSSPGRPAARTRIALALLALPAAVVLLGIVLPGSANLPEIPIDEVSTAPVVGGVEVLSADDGEAPTSVMFNTPVLVREVHAQKPEAEADTTPIPLRALNTTRILFGSRPMTPEEIVAAPVSQPAAAFAPQPIDRDALPPALVVAQASLPASAPVSPNALPWYARPPAAPKVEPPAAAPAPPAAAAKVPDPPKARPREPSISTPYEQVAPETPRATRQRPRRSQTNAPPRAPRPRPVTAPPPPEEPSTLAKIFQGLNPFAPDSEPAATPKAPVSARKTQQPPAKTEPAKKEAAKTDTFWWGEQQPTR